MTPRSGRRSRPVRGGSAEPLNLIHRSNCSNPVLARPAAVSYSIEWGVSEAVVRAAFEIALKLHRGGYERTS